MSAKALYESFQQCLDVKTYVLSSSIQGNEIQVGETFKVRIKVTNTAPAGTNDPDIRFNNIKVHVRGTEYATPTSGNSVFLDLNDSVLTRGDDGYVDVEFKAKKAIFDAFGTVPLLLPENVAKIAVGVDIDLSAFFRIRKSVDAFADIVTN